MHGGSLNAPSALRFGQAATRVLCSKLSPAGVRKASRLNSCFNLVPIYKRNQRGFLLRPFSFHPLLSFSTIQRLNNQASKNLKFWSGSWGWEGGLLGHHFYGGHRSDGVGAQKESGRGATWKRIRERVKKKKEKAAGGRWKLLAYKVAIRGKWPCVRQEEHLCLLPQHTKGPGGGGEGVGGRQKKDHGLQHERGPHQTPHAGFEWANLRLSALARH